MNQPIGGKVNTHTYTRYVSRGTLKLDCFVIHRGASGVRYHFDDPAVLYERDAKEFDAIYSLPNGRN